MDNGWYPLIDNIILHLYILFIGHGLFLSDTSQKTSFRKKNNVNKKAVWIKYFLQLDDTVSKIGED